MAPYSDETLSAFTSITTATITMVLLKKGIRNVWLRGAFAMQDDQERIAGPAFTMRYLPGREDLSTPEALSSPRSTRHAIEDMPAGCVTVVAADGCKDAGVFGDILCERMRVRGVRGMVTDGVMRDVDGVRDTGFNVWSAGAAAPASISCMTFADWQQPIGCGGVAIFPNDLIVADNDGAVVVPQKLADEVLEAALEQEQLEAWILDEVKGGAELPGLYPPNEDNRARFLAARKKSK